MEAKWTNGHILSAKGIWKISCSMSSIKLLAQLRNHPLFNSRYANEVNNVIFKHFMWLEVREIFVNCDSIVHDSNVCSAPNPNLGTSD